MKETEVKILDIDKDAVEKKILALGAEKIFDGDIHALYFDTEEKKLKAEEKVLRLRKIGEKVELTYKEPADGKQKAKVRHELETDVSDFGMTKRLLERLGFRPWREVKKRRTSYRLGNVRFEIDVHEDNFSWIEPFLEIEAPDEETIYATAAKLGFSRDDCKGDSIDALHEHYGKNPEKYNL